MTLFVCSPKFLYPHELYISALTLFLFYFEKLPCYMLIKLLIELSICFLYKFLFLGRVINRLLSIWMHNDVQNFQVSKWQVPSIIVSSIAKGLTLSYWHNSVAIIPILIPSMTDVFMGHPQILVSYFNTPSCPDLI